MSAASKSRLLIFLMIAMALVFFVTSVIAVAVSNDIVEAPAPEKEAAGCMQVRTAEKVFLDCSLP